MEDTGAVVGEGELGTVNPVWSHRHQTHLGGKVKSRNSRKSRKKGYSSTHPMGTAGFDLEIVLKCKLTGALKADSTTHAVQHSLHTGYTVG